jgi:hypothetical protein
MAKKTAKKTGKKRLTANKTKSKKSSRKVESIEIELDPIQTAAFELAYSSEEVRRELESGVSEAISRAVRKVFKRHEIALSQPQALEVAGIMFGD